MEGHDIRRDMASVYSLMGVCPQHDLLWPQLTAAEHLRFYGRIKGLKVSSMCGIVLLFSSSSSARTCLL